VLFAGSITPCNKLAKKATRGRQCECCDILEECNEFSFSGQSQLFQIRFHFDCDTRNFIYALTCDGCGDNYIGKSERTVRERCGEHRRAIKNSKFTQGVHQHIARCGAGVFSMAPFYKIKTLNRGSVLTLTHEDFFIEKFAPSLNRVPLLPS
jgi:hypothetical protein